MDCGMFARCCTVSCAHKVWNVFKFVFGSIFPTGESCLCRARHSRAVRVL